MACARNELALPPDVRVFVDQRIAEVVDSLRNTPR
jgi:hypothetical protein